MKYDKDYIAAHLDLAVLKPTATYQDVKDACALANKHGIKSVCVAPIYVKLASSMFDNVSCVIGYPHGNTLPAVKYAEANQSINNGAKELDVVVNYGRFLDGDSEPLKTELSMIMAIARFRGVLVKAILETCHYTPRQLINACELCAIYGVDYIKTSTGALKGATPGVVKIIRDSAPGVPVKASGGIKTYEQVCGYFDLGVGRIGASSFGDLLP
jgi:deoxyribose-phosphate aldolase